MEVVRQRDPFVDYLKGVAILLVVFGHSIQYSNGGHGFFDNPGFKFIYMFHMPLFAMLSGYVSVTIADKTFKELFLTKVKQLYIPSLIWNWMGVIVTGILYVLFTREIPDIGFTFFGYWFITTIILCSFVLWSVLRLARNKPIGRVLVFACVLMLLLPDWGEGKMLKYLFPFFALGYWMNQYKDRLIRRKNQIGIAAIVLFIACFCLWKNNDYIYTTPSTLYGTNNLKILTSYSLRLLAGACGSFMVIYFLSYTYKWLLFAEITSLGCYTFSIYMIQQIFFNYIAIVANYTSYDFSPCIYNGVIVPVIAVAVLLSCLGIIRILSANKFASVWLLGKDKKYPSSRKYLFPQTRTLSKERSNDLQEI